MRLSSIGSSTENLRLPVSRIISIFSQGPSVLPEDEIREEDDHDDEEYTTDMENALHDGLGDNLSDVLG